MPLAYLLDENLRGRLWRAIRRHNEIESYPLDAVRVGDPYDLSLSSDDSSILKWAKREERIVVTKDKNTFPIHFANHLRAGHHSPGLFMIRPNSNIPFVVEYLVLAAYVSEPVEWQDRIDFIP